MSKLLVLLPPGGPPAGYYDDAVRLALLNGSVIIGLYVRDGVWRRFSSADWLSTGASRSEFDRYMGGVLAAEGEAMSKRLGAIAAGSGVAYVYESMEGDPDGPPAGFAALVGADYAVSPETIGRFAAGL
jgi:hypothetical protein